MGKTYQLRHYLVTVGVKVFSISAADLESDRAGEPAKLLKRKYLEASDCITDGNPSALLIDDVDTTLRRMEKLHRNSEPPGRLGSFNAFGRQPLLY